MYSTKHKTIG